MKIIDKKPWSMEFTCAGCKSVLQAEAEDVRYWRGSCMGETESGYDVTCPVCGTERNIDLAHLPVGVRTAAEERRVARAARAAATASPSPPECEHKRTRPCGKMGYGRGDDKECLDCGKVI